MENNKNLNLFYALFCFIATLFQLIIFISFIVGLVLNKDFLFDKFNDGYLIGYIILNLIIMSIFSYLSRYTFNKLVLAIEEEQLKIETSLLVRTQKHYYLKLYTPILIFILLRKKYKNEF